MDKAAKTQKLEQISRNYVAQAAKSKNSAGHMRDRRNRRAKDARKHWSKEQW